MSLAKTFHEIRREFPITETRFPVIGEQKEKPLTYFDHAASTHPPRLVLKTYTDFLEHYYCNVGRGNYTLALHASDRFEQALETIAKHIGGNLKDHAIVMTSNTTQALNLASHIMAEYDGITLCTGMEHHSNDLPHRKRGRVEYVSILSDGTLDMVDLENKLKTHKVKLVAVTGASNVTGVLPRIDHIAKLAHEHGARILVDAAQLLAHLEINVQGTNTGERIDFLAAAGHKAYAPFGSAFLYGPRELLSRADSFLPGGGTVVYVTHDEVMLKDSPERHDGGTPNIAGAIALAESLKFLQTMGMTAIRVHEKALLCQVLDGLRSLEGVAVYGPADPETRLGVFSFNVGDLSHELVSAILNYEGAIATRNGSFCAQPYVLQLLGIQDLQKFKREAALAGSCSKDNLPGAVRGSFGIYNTEEEVEDFLTAIRVIRDKKWKGNYQFIPSQGWHPA